MIASTAFSNLVFDLIKIVVGALVTVLSAGLIGNLLTYQWDEVRRRRESDLAARDGFYSAYAQFFTTWKLWNTHIRHQRGHPPNDVQWQLLTEAEKAEGAFESLLVKIASERELDDNARQLLAAFRQACQSLRESIRDNQPLAWWATNVQSDKEGYRQYRAFKGLAEYVAILLAEDRRRELFSFLRSRRQPETAYAITSLLAITLRIESWTDVAYSLLELDLPSDPQ
jgi:hypothetical protein